MPFHPGQGRRADDLLHAAHAERPAQRQRQLHLLHEARPLGLRQPLRGRLAEELHQPQVEVARLQHLHAHQAARRLRRLRLRSAAPCSRSTSAPRIGAFAGSACAATPASVPAPNACPAGSRRPRSGPAAVRCAARRSAANRGKCGWRQTTRRRPAGSVYSPTVSSASSPASRPSGPMPTLAAVAAVVEALLRRRPRAEDRVVEQAAGPRQARPDARQGRELVAGDAGWCRGPSRSRQLVRRRHAAAEAHHQHRPAEVAGLVERVAARRHVRFRRPVGRRRTAERPCPDLRGRSPSSPAIRPGRRAGRRRSGRPGRGSRTALTRGGEAEAAAHLQRRIDGQAGPVGEAGQLDAVEVAGRRPTTTGASNVRPSGRPW